MKADGRRATWVPTRPQTERPLSTSEDWPTRGTSGQNTQRPNSTSTLGGDDSRP